MALTILTTYQTTDAEDAIAKAEIKLKGMPKVTKILKTKELKKRAKPATEQQPKNQDRERTVDQELLVQKEKANN